MTATQNVEVAIHNGKKYVTAVYRGSRYSVSDMGGYYGIVIGRLALGRSNFGSFKNGGTTLEQVAKTTKAFGTAEDLYKLFFGISA